METLGVILFFVLLYVAWKCTEYLWNEWGGAYGRWRRREPLRQSALLSQQWRERREGDQRKKAEIRRRYERNNSLILDHAFRAQFRSLGLHDDIRAEVLQECEHTCRLCGKQPKRKGKLHVDHIRPQRQYPELEYVVSNLQALCATCNRHKQGYDGDDWREVTKQRLKATRKRKAALRKADPANEP